MTTLITGARGAVARHLMNLHDDAGLPYRAATADPATAAATPGTVHLDLAAPGTFAPALTGIKQVFLYASAEHIDVFIKEAAAAGVRHVVLLSSSAVLAEDAENNLMAKAHLDVENALLASPLPTTVLRPGSFAGNARGWAWAIKSGSPVNLPFPGAHNDPIHELDVAECAFSVLADRSKAGQVYHLTGPASMDFRTQIAELSAALGRTVEIAQVTPDAWKAEVAAYVPAPYADALIDWWRSNDGKPVDTTGTVATLTGHPARPFTTWAEDNAADFA
ncbi:NAD(P)H-binding protein [Yinghuangia soli]|uniref:NAD(P)H-binding protein n=1 Tax=Yinghuangia soli TaxID=2908204 RepID=A0AA41Q4Q4_9ACTN|nr:NAD(P)H-binding protein [Yinghuangia soli]MCF2530067.1 NAD(P)H-binding protein [Yinghuangia soli]